MGTPSNIDFVGLRWQKAQWIADDQGRPVLSVPRDQECGACRFKINTAHQKGCPSMEDSFALGIIGSPTMRTWLPLQPVRTP